MSTEELRGGLVGLLIGFGITGWAGVWLGWRLRTWRYQWDFARNMVTVARRHAIRNGLKDPVSPEDEQELDA